jgi:hypothetical protein
MRCTLAFALATVVACRSNEAERIDQLTAKVADLEKRLAIADQRGSVDATKVASELLAKGSAA